MNQHGLHQPSAGTLCGILAVLFWSFTAPVVASAPGINPFLYTALNDAIVVALFACKWFIMRENPLPDLKRVPLWFFGFGIICIAAHNLTWVAALQEAPPLEATLIIYTWPLLVVIFTTLSLHQKFHWHHMVGGTLGLIGIIVLMMGRGLDLAGLSLTYGHLWAAICALSWAIFCAVSARHDYLKNNFLCVVFIGSGLINASVWYLWFDAPSAPQASLIIAGVGAIFFGIAYMLWDYGIKRGNAQLIGVISFLTPVLAAFYLIALGKAELNAYLLASLAFVMGAIAVAKYGDKWRIKI